jgi:hypothetical protein
MPDPDPAGADDTAAAGAAVSAPLKEAMNSIAEAVPADVDVVERMKELQDRLLEAQRALQVRKKNLNHFFNAIFTCSLILTSFPPFFFSKNRSYLKRDNAH